LDKCIPYHNISHHDAISDTTCYASEYDALCAKTFNQGTRRRCSSNFANARQGQHNRLALDLTAPEIPTGTLDAARIFEHGTQAILLLGEGTENGGGGRRLHVVNLPQNFAALDYLSQWDCFTVRKLDLDLKYTVCCASDQCFYGCEATDSELRHAADHALLTGLRAGHRRQTAPAPLDGVSP
jgi:hypothetical protein